MKCFILTTFFWAAVGLIAAAAVVGMGLYNISALKGHLPGVAWLLHTTYHNSVELRAPPESEAPDLARPDLIELGAKHYDSACRFCHASPGERQARTADAMEPPPPHVEEAAAKWEPRHLFWIVRHGVKMTGMPAWPSGARDDDVWALVAFLARVPGMDARAYRNLARPRGAPDSAGRANCENCHDAGGDGGANGLIPRLDIQSEAYLAASLRAYRDGRRHSGIMQHAASGLSDGEIGEHARRFAAQGSTRPKGAARPKTPLAELGRRLAASASAESDTPACAACHGPWPTRRSERFPRLAGQHFDYLYTQLKLWKNGRRGGTDRAHIMHKVVPNLEEPEMRALAEYYASLPPGKQ